MPPALARWLTDRHCPSTHTNELGLDAADDRDIWTRACAERLIVISKAEDFFALANRQGDTGFLRFLVRVVGKQARHLRQTDGRLLARPMSVDVAASMDADAELAERVEAFVSRFARLQRHLGR